MRGAHDRRTEGAAYTTSTGAWRAAAAAAKWRRPAPVARATACYCSPRRKQSCVYEKWGNDVMESCFKNRHLSRLPERRSNIRRSVKPNISMRACRWAGRLLLRRAPFSPRGSTCIASTTNFWSVDKISTYALNRNCRRRGIGGATAAMLSR